MRAFRQRRLRPADRGPQGIGLPSLKSVMSLMEYELARARRYERPLSIIAVHPEAVASARLPLRFSDLSGVSSDGESVLLMLPETTATGASALARRLSEPGVEADDIYVATFPDDGVTLDDLLSRVRATPASRVGNAW